jgi:hypothetical protein
MSDNKRSAGRLKSVASCLPAVEVDCSQWPRQQSATRSAGKLVRAGEALSGSAVPPSPSPTIREGKECRQAGHAWFELIVTFAPDVPPTEVWEQVNLLLQTVTSAAPELMLTYDALRSRAENGDIVIALTPTGLAAGSDRLATLTDALRAAPASHIHVRGIRLAA